MLFAELAHQHVYVDNKWMSLVVLCTKKNSNVYVNSDMTLSCNNYVFCIVSIYYFLYTFYSRGCQSLRKKPFVLLV